jgi:anti-sigma regulatory factor (Ser/Thr protein kinase)
MRMQSDRPVPVNGRAALLVEDAFEESQISRLRDTCRRQALALDKQSDLIALLRTGGRALKAENADLRGENARLRDAPATPALVNEARAQLVARLTLDECAPRAARHAVADCVADQVTPAVLADAKLLISEMVSNSVRHSAATGQAVIVRVGMERTLLRLEVEDSGCAGAIAPRAPDLNNGGGLGLQLVHELSERWAIERAAGGRTRIWAYLRRAPLTHQGNGAKLAAEASQEEHAAALHLSHPTDQDR